MLGNFSCDMGQKYDTLQAGKWFYVVKSDFMRLQVVYVVKSGFMWLRVAKSGFMWLKVV